MIVSYLRTSVDGNLLWQPEQTKTQHINLVYDQDPGNHLKSWHWNLISPSLKNSTLTKRIGRKWGMQYKNYKYCYISIFYLYLYYTKILVQFIDYHRCTETFTDNHKCLYLNLETEMISIGNASNNLSDFLQLFATNCAESFIFLYYLFTPGIPTW